MDDIQQLKRQLRKRVGDSLKTLSAEEVSRQSMIITAKATSLPEYAEASSLSIFMSMPGREVATQDIVKHALRDGKKVYVPYIHPSKTDAKSKSMDMLRLMDEEDLDSLEPDAWGIPSLPKQSINNRENALGGRGCLDDSADDGRETASLDLIFVPSVAFDSLSNRLGHGKGFYDRYLSFCQSRLTSGGQGIGMPRLVGLALKEQLLPPDQTLPVTEHDWKVDRVVTAGDE